MNSSRIASIFTAVVATATAACGVELSPEESATASAALETATVSGSSNLTAMQRMERLGLTDVRGIAYDPGPVADAQGKYGFSPDDFVLVPESTERRYTIYNDADFANADFSSLWGKGPDGEGRDDLGRFKQELNVNLVTLYDWNAGSDAIPQTRDHKPFFDYAASLGIKVTASVSDWIRKEQLCAHRGGTTEEGMRGVARVVKEVYPGGKPLPALGLIKIFNEPENQKVCPGWAKIVADTIATVQDQENALGVADADRVPVFVPTTFGIRHGLAGGALKEVHEAIAAHPKLGEGFWNERMVIAVNPFNEGFFMKDWLTKALPAFEAKEGISPASPVLFTEYGKSAEELGNDLGKQAAWVAEQLAAVKVHPTAAFVGSVAFVNQVRPWRTGTEYGFGLMDFGGDGGAWAKPRRDYLAKVLYTNPNGGGGKWDGAYPVQRQTPRPAYAKVAEAYRR